MLKWNISPANIINREYVLLTLLIDGISLSNTELDLFLHGKVRGGFIC